MMEFGMPTLLENENIEDCIALCKELSLDFIELNMNFPQYQTDQIDVAYYKTLAKENHIYYTIHLEEDFNVFGYNSEVTLAYRNTMLRTIEIAKQLRTPILNMHMAEGIYVTLPKERVYLFERYEELYLQRLMEFKELCEAAIGDSNIKICIENSNGYRAYARRGIELLLESKVFALTYDLGHDHAIQGMDESFIKKHKDQLIHMHVHDAIGAKNHLAIGEGEINMKEKLSLARECNCRCVLETKTVAGLTESVKQLNSLI